jgi:hypothetical protein
MMHLPLIHLRKPTVPTMKKILFLLFINIFYLGKSQMLGQSGWTRNKGGVYAKVGFYSLNGSTYYNTEGVKTPSNTFHQQALTLFGEYGITKNITTILNFPVVKAQYYNDAKPAVGVGNPQIELKFALLKKFPVVSFSVGAELPISPQTNYSVARQANSFGIIEKINLPTGYPDFNYWGTLAVSSGFWKGTGWGTVYSQYIVRGKDFNDQAKLGFELGYKWTPKFWTNARLVGWYKAGSKTSSVNSSIINGKGTQYTSLGIGAAYEIVKHWSVTADFQTANNLLVRPKNIQGAPLFQLGVSAEF